MSLLSFNIKAKATLLATSTFVGALGVVAVAEMYRVKADLKEVIGIQQLSFVSQEAKDIDEKFQLRVRALDAAARFIARSLTGPPGGDEMRRYLDSLPVLGEMFDDVFAFAADGAMLARFPYATIPDGATAADREYFRNTVSTRTGRISEPYLAKASNQPSVMLTAPILHPDGQVLAVLGGQLNLLKPNFLGHLREAAIGRTGSFALISNDRTIVVSRDRERIMTKEAVPGVTRYVDRLVAGHDGWEEDVNSRSLHALYAYKHLDSMSWALVAALPIEEAYAPIVAAQKRIAIGTIVLVAVLAPLVWFGALRLLDPLVILRDSIRQIRERPGQGDLLPDNQRDEVGDLARDFNALLRERREAGRALGESEARFRDVTDNIAALIGYIDAEQVFRFNNRTYEAWLGKPRERITGCKVRDVLGNEAYEKFSPYIHRALNGERVEFQSELISFGSSRAIQGVYVPHLTDDGRVAGFYTFVSDITALKEAEERLVHAAHHDPLTGAANRSLLQDRIQQAAARSRRSGAHLALLYLDIDKFKSINDSGGHAAGDALLRQFALRLQDSVRATDTVARLGGDEFVVLLEEINERTDALSVADKILAATRTPIMVADVAVTVTTSIGIAFAGAADVNADDLVKRADVALYEAKRAGRNTYRVAV